MREVEDGGRGLGRAFVALEHRSFRLLFLSTVVSAMGGQLQSIANLWQVYALTGSALHLGLTGLARAIPIIFFSLAGGVVADRFDRSKIIVGTQAANGAIALLLGLLSLTGLVEVWHIYAATFLNATLMAVSNPARRAVIAGLVPRRHLVNATALNSVVHQLDRIVAPALAGILIAVVGLPLTYGVNGAAHIVAAVALSRIALGPLPTRPEVSPLHSLWEGLSFVRVRTIILVLLGLDSATMLVGSYQVLLPVLSSQFEMGAAGYGLLAAAPAVGGFAGAIVIMYLGDFPYKGRVISGSFFGYAGFLVGLALAPSFPVAFLAAVGLGLTDAIQAALRNALVQLMTPDQLRGRVSSFQHMLTGGVPALGQSLLGAAAAAIGAPVALVVAAVVCATFNLGTVTSRRDLRARDLGALAARVHTSSGEIARIG